MVNRKKFYDLWVALRGKCNNPSAPGWMEYGAKGRYLCAEWDKSEKFIEDMLKEYVEGYYLHFFEEAVELNSTNFFWSSRRQYGEDFTGQRFGRLVGVHPSSRSQYWVYLCDCGKEKEIKAASVKGGAVKSCGCLQKEWAHLSDTDRKGTHNKSKTLEYSCWHEMLRREKRTKDRTDKYVGMEVEESWKNDFMAFLGHIGPQPDTEHEWSVDRIDNDKGYIVGNVRWATTAQQARNRGKRSDNTSGITGICLRKGSWYAMWQDLEGQQHTRCFSVKRFGNDEAFNMAVQRRKEAIEELNEQGAGYSEKHGL